MVPVVITAAYYLPNAAAGTAAGALHETIALASALCCVGAISMLSSQATAPNGTPLAAPASARLGRHRGTSSRDGGRGAPVASRVGARGGRCVRSRDRPRGAPSRICPSSSPPFTL